MRVIRGSTGITTSREHRDSSTSDNSAVYRLLLLMTQWTSRYSPQNRVRTVVLDPADHWPRVKDEHTLDRTKLSMWHPPLLDSVCGRSLSSVARIHLCIRALVHDPGLPSPLRHGVPSIRACRSDPDNGGQPHKHLQYHLKHFESTIAHVFHIRRLLSDRPEPLL